MQLLNLESTGKDLPTSSAEAGPRAHARTKANEATSGAESCRRLRRKQQPQPWHADAALRKQVVAPMNLRLTEQGYQVERLLCEQRCADINFRRAPKGSLAKYGDAIRKDPVAAQRWAAIAAVSASAVPDLNDLSVFVDAFLDTRRGGGTSEVGLMQRRSVSKAIDSAVAERSRLTARAMVLLDQVKDESPLGTKDGEDAPKQVLLPSIGDELRANVPCLPLVDMASGASSRDSVALLLVVAFVCFRVQERLGVLPKPASPVVAADAAAVDPTTTSAAAEASAASGDGAADEKTDPASSTVDGDNFALQVDEVERAITAAGGMGNDAVFLDAAILAHAGRALLESCSAHPGREGVQERRADVMLLCSAFHASNDSAAFKATIAELRCRALVYLLVLALSLKPMITAMAPKANPCARCWSTGAKPPAAAVLMGQCRFGRERSCDPDQITRKT